MIATAHSRYAGAPDYCRDPDVRLMLQVRSGSNRAFEELFHKHRPSVIAILRREVGRREQAEDLAQEVFLRVYRARRNYRPKARFTTWLFTITRHVAFNANRTSTRKREVLLSDTTCEESPRLDELATSAIEATPERQLERNEMIHQVRRAMDSLRERQRTILVLARFENHTYHEIAARLGLTVLSVKSHALRARAKLRTALAGYMQDEEL